MFTGLIEAIGVITQARAAPGGDLRIAVSTGFKGVALGESIAVNGCCLTVAAFGAGSGKSGALRSNASAAFTLSAETLARTAPRWRAGEKVNLERALKLGDRLGGHLVSGHVDGTARLIGITPDRDSRILTLEAPRPLAKFIAEKGSVTLDGVSLTVNTVKGKRFSVNIIPHTWERTTLSEREPGDLLNLEVDLLARYAARLITFDR